MKRLMDLGALVLMMEICVLLPGCGGSGSMGNSGGNTKNPATLKTIAITPSMVTLNAGQTQQLTATGSYSDGSTKDLTSSATWSSSGSAVATVSSSGLVTSVAQGKVSISASFASVTGSAQITVNLKALESIAIAPSDLTLNAGHIQQLGATATLSDGSTQDVTNSASWTSSDTKVAIVSSTGLLSSIAEGTSTISATIQGLTATSALTVPTPVVTVFGNLSDSHLIEVPTADGSIIDYWGTKDANGMTTAVTSATVSTGGLVYTYAFTGGKPSTMTGPDGTTLTFTWQSSSVANVAYTAPSGQTYQFPNTISLSTPASNTASSIMKSHVQPQSDPLPMAADAVGSSAVPCPSGLAPNQSSITVNACGGPVKTAQVSLIGNVGLGLVNFPAQNQGDGTYIASLPVADPNAGAEAAAKCNSFITSLSNSATDSVCSVLSAISQSNAGAGLCSALLLYGPEAAAACVAVLDNADKLCSIKDGICGAVETAVDLYQDLGALPAVGLQAISTVPGGYLTASDSASAPVDGPMACFNIDYGSSSTLCDPAFINVSPLNPSVAAGGSVNLKAATTNLVGQAVTPSLTWQSSTPSIATVEPADSTDALVQAGTEQGSTTITATEKDGAAGVTTVNVTNSASLLYALVYPSVTAPLELDSIDTTTGAETPIVSLGVPGTDTVAFGNGRLYFYPPPTFYSSPTGTAQTGTAQLMMVDTTAPTPTVTAIGGAVTEPDNLFVDNLSGALYALVYPSVTAPLELDLIDTTTGAETPIVSLGVSGIDVAAFGNGRLYFYTSPTGTAQLKMVDTTAPTPAVTAIGGAVTEPENLFVDNLSGALYALVYPSDTSPLVLDSINTTTGAETPIVSLGVSGIDVAAFGNGRLYFYTSPTGTAQLKMVDTTAPTPAVTAIGGAVVEPENLFVGQ